MSNHELTIYERLKKQREEMLDLHRVSKAALTDLENRVHELEIKVSYLTLALETNSRYLQHIDKIYAESIGVDHILNDQKTSNQVDKSKTYSINDVHEELKRIFGKRVLREDFLDALMDIRYLTRYMGKGKYPQYSPLSQGIKQGILCDPKVSNTKSCRFTNKGLNYTIEILKKNGWKEVQV